MYDPLTARFLQEDTYTGTHNDPLSLNLYTYCHNEPLMYSDPTGHKSLWKKIRDTVSSAVSTVSDTTRTVTNAVRTVATSAPVRSAVRNVATRTLLGTAMASNTISKSLHKTMQTTVTEPFEDFLGKIRDIPSNIEYSCSSPNRFFSAALGASVKVIGNLVLSPTAFVMDYTVFLPNTIQNIVRGEENCPIGTCSSAVDQLMDNIDTYCVNDLGVDQRAYEGGESNADVFTTTVGVYYGIKGICSLAESVAAWRNASGIARNASTAAEGQMTGGMGDAADDVVSGIVGDTNTAAESEMTGVMGDAADDVVSGIARNASTAAESEMTGVMGDAADDVASGIVGDAENAVEGTSNTTQQLQGLANKANQAVPGQGTVPGTLKHTEFANQVKGLNNPLLQPEVTYKNGQIVSYGTKGGVRLDVVEYNANGTIKAVYDLKTGKAGLTNSRIQEIQNNLPNNAPVYEIRPK